MKRLATPWSAVVKSSQASEQSDQSVASEGYSPSNALSIKNSSSAQSLSKAMRSPVESPGSPRQRQAGESDSATSSASKHEGVEGKLDEQQVRGDEVRTNGQVSENANAKIRAFVWIIIDVDDGSATDEYVGCGFDCDYEMGAVISQDIKACMESTTEAA